jgi:hypothetical protein
MKMDNKHKSKLHKGFERQRTRQDNKPCYVKVTVTPIVLSWSCKHSEYKSLKQKFWNNKWNGMNLKNLCNSFTVTRVGGMYGKFTVNSEGKYKLSMHGKDLLRKRRQRRISAKENLKQKEK